MKGNSPEDRALIVWPRPNSRAKSSGVTPKLYTAYTETWTTSGPASLVPSVTSHTLRMNPKLLMMAARPYMIRPPPPLQAPGAPLLIRPALATLAFLVLLNSTQLTPAQGLYSAISSILHFPSSSETVRLFLTTSSKKTCITPTQPSLSSFSPLIYA